MEPSPPGTGSPEKPRVVVVGAGFAGVAAAGALQAAGICDVIVLEAQDRAGGRVHSVQLEDGLVELGAQFIHGERGNQLYELAERYGQLLDSALYQSGNSCDSSVEDYLSHHFLTSDGGLLAPGSATRLLRAANHIFRDYANSFFARRTARANIPRRTLPADHSNATPSVQATRDPQSSDPDLNCPSLLHNGPRKTEGGCQPEDSGDVVPGQVALHALDDPDDYIINYGGQSGVQEGEEEGEEEDSFAGVLRKCREIILHADEDVPEDIKLALLKWMEQWEYTDNAARLQDVSLHSYGKYGYIQGYGLTVTCSGLEEVFRVFLQDSVPRDCLLLNTPVSTIMWAQPPPGPTPPPGSPDGGPAQQGHPQERQENGRGVTRDIGSADRGPTSSPQDLTETRDLQRHQQGPHGARPVRVVCHDGREFCADHVIVTCSMGCLKREEAMFQPPLPDEVRRAVRQMGFGVVAKVFLLWDRLDQVLEPGVEGVQFLWLDSRHPVPRADTTARKTQNGGNWYDFLQGFERVESHKGALLTWLAGEEAEIMESLPEQEVKDVLHELMARFLGNPQLPRPRHVVRSMWHANSYVRGSYSYIPAHMDPQSHDLLSVPLPSAQNPVLQLCGEATSRRFYSTVHGAIDSGIRAARAIVRHHSQQSTRTEDTCLQGQQ
ncbi:spermine oxidase-like [Babylonia areolata]|uniref:spermine oxidase-like n=1 Tax=Babylonia areolata TaxID=304850 RepID=UPI003FD0A5E7